MFFTNFFSKTPTITTDKLAELLAKKTPITVLDVRTPPEFHTAHLPNVRNYPLVQIDSYSNSKKIEYILSVNLVNVVKKLLRFCVTKDIKPSMLKVA